MPEYKGSDIPINDSHLGGGKMLLQADNLVRPKAIVETQDKKVSRFISPRAAFFLLFWVLVVLTALIYWKWSRSDDVHYAESIGQEVKSTPVKEKTETNKSVSYRATYKAPDISGIWKGRWKIEGRLLNPLSPSEIEFKISIKQNGSKLTGTITYLRRKGTCSVSGHIDHISGVNKIMYEYKYRDGTTMKYIGTVNNQCNEAKGKWKSTGSYSGSWKMVKIKESTRTFQQKYGSVTRAGHLFIQTEPVGSGIGLIMNNRPKFYQGMELKPGRYHLEVSAPNYETRDLWVKINAGEDKNLSVKLKRTVIKAHVGKPGEYLIISQNIPISADTTIWRDYNNNCGDYNGSSNKGIGVSTRANINRLHRALLKFKVEEIPPGTKIAKATVRLYALKQSEYRDNYFHISRLTERWESSVTTWCKRTVSKSWSTHGGVWARKGQATVLIPSKHGSDWHQATGSYKEWIEWDVTQIVKDWVENSKPNFGFIVHQTDIGNLSENQGIDFCSKEYSEVNLRPQLVVRANVGEKQVVQTKAAGAYSGIVDVPASRISRKTTNASATVRNVKVLRKRARELVRKGKWPEAAGLAEQIVHKSPRTIKDRRFLGLCLLNASQYQRGIYELEKILRYGHSDAVVEHYLGYAYFKVGSYEKALSAYKRAIRIDPANPRHYKSGAQLIVEVCGIQPRFHRYLPLAKTWYERAIALGTHPSKLANVKRVLKLNGRLALRTN